MATEVTVPQSGESITEVQIGAWLKNEGDFVEEDEALVELETDKASMELPSPVSGRITELRKKEGETAEIGEVIALIDETAQSGEKPEKAGKAVPAREEKEDKAAARQALKAEQRTDKKAAKTSGEPRDPVEVTVPESGESITEVQIGSWLKKEGEYVEEDEVLVELETDKASMELSAPSGGIVFEIRKSAGETAKIGETIAIIDRAGTREEAGAFVEAEEEKAPDRMPEEKKAGEREVRAEAKREEKRQEESARLAAKMRGTEEAEEFTMPAARELMQKHGISAAEVAGTGPGRRILKEDVQRAIERRQEVREDTGRAASERKRVERPGAREDAYREEEEVPMSMIRKHIAKRLVEAQQNAAMLTTFNDCNMQAVMDLREQYRDVFERKYGIRLGIMSFFVKAAIDALKTVPEVNAEIRDEKILYKNYYDIGVAVGGGKGLVVPVLRNAERMSFAEIELTIADFARRAKENKLSVDELQGGTFTISNGGVYGSLLSTPILNPPQSGILGLHRVEDRPVVENGQIVIRPMMYLALTYDHRIVDGKGAVTCLKRIKDVIENPARMLIEI